MTVIKEDFLQYIWKNKLFNNELYDNSGNKIEILNGGVQNTDSGPDFFNAKIKINNAVWIGNIEVHKNSSEWYKHFHNTNKAYDNVILHVVLNNDKDVFRTNGEKILTAEMKFDSKLLDNYNELINRQNKIPCYEDLKKVNNFIIKSWLHNVLIERIEQKIVDIKRVHIYTKNNWRETLYISLAGSFGFKTNKDTSELLAKSLSGMILAKHKTNIFQLEALLFGQSGLLSENIENDYFLELKKEYSFLQRKYNIKPIERHLWKFMRMRPPNFPTVRIAQFAGLISISSHLFSKIINSKSIDEIKQFFCIKTSKFWDTHYTFKKKSKKRIKILGETSINTIIINTVIPIIFLYGKEKGNEKLINKSLDFLTKIKAEKNNIITKWNDSGIKITSAYESQALIQLYNEYCLKKRCLNCRIGNQLIIN